MQAKNKKYRIILLLIFSILCSCKVDKKSKKDSNKVEEKIIIDNIINPKKIDSLIKSGFPYIEKEFNLYGYSSEGDGVKSYLDERGHLVKIKATYFGDSGKSEWSYYFNDDSLFFVEEKEYRYMEPISHNCNPVINSIMRSEYFLEKENLKKWVNENGFIVDSMSEKFKQEGNYLIQDVREFRQKIKALMR